MRNKLVEIVKKSLVKNIDYTHRLAENITDDLIANGVIVPPCKIGDVVYQTDGVIVYESTITNIIYDTNNIAFDERAIGKTIYLTKDEAEKHLKG